MCDWVCYLIKSLDSSDTYIGATNDPERRLRAHNDIGASRKGARRTRNQTWMPVIIVSGFVSKRACLSFESGWRRLSRRRTQKRLFAISEMTAYDLKYQRDTIWNRIMDLIFFVYHFSAIGHKFMANHDLRHPLMIPDELSIKIFLLHRIADLPWPYFVKCT